MPRWCLSQRYLQYRFHNYQVFWNFCFNLTYVQTCLYHVSIIVYWLGVKTITVCFNQSLNDVIIAFIFFLYCTYIEDLVICHLPINVFVKKIMKVHVCLTIYFVLKCLIHIHWNWKKNTGINNIISKDAIT